MNKEQKKAVVDELSRELADSEAIFAIDYRGISVPQAAELRAGLREADARFRVVKNRLTLLAADKAGTEPLKEHLEGPTALALVHGDAAAAAKTIFRLGREWEVLDYKGGLMDGEVLNEDSFVEIARLPSRDQLDAQLAGIVASPLTGLVRGLGSMVQGLALQLQAIADQGLVTGEETPKENAAPAAAGDEGGSGEEAAGGEDAGAGDADPDPSESPEEEPSEEEAPAGEDAGEGAKADETTEGDAEVGDAAEEAQQEEETSEDSDEEKEEDS
ncbi:MAG: 50S ribosomal protein L10 [Solirubrobacterales bacterium]